MCLIHEMGLERDWPRDAYFLYDGEDLITLEFSDLKLRSTRQGSGNSVDATGPRNGHDREVGRDLSTQLSEPAQPIAPQVSIVNHDPRRLHVADGVFKLVDVPVIVEEAPVVHHQFLKQEGLADPGPSDNDEVVLGSLESLDFFVSPDEGDIYRWASGRR